MSHDELEQLRERYLKLVDMHGQLQMQNSVLEERVLDVVESCSNERKQLEQALLDAKQQIIYLQETVNELQVDKQRYKDDCNLAVRLLHQHPQEFIATTASGQMQEQLKARNEPASQPNPPIASQRSVVLPTFPPTFVALPPMLPPSTAASVTSAPVVTTSTPDNLRLAAETLFKSNSVHRSPSTQFTCSECRRTVKRCDVSVQASLSETNEQSVASRLRLVSLSASDDGHGNDGAWLSLDSPQAHFATGKPLNQQRAYEEVPVRSMPRMHHV